MRHLPPRLFLGSTTVVAICSLVLIAPVAAPAVVLDVQAVDGPSADVIDERAKGAGDARTAQGDLKR